MKKVFLSVALILSSYAHASVVKQSAGEWRPKSAVQAPHGSYMLLGEKEKTSTKSTLWTTPIAYMLRMKKNSWAKIQPENCDSDSKKILHDKRTQEFFEAGGQIMMTRLSDGNMTVRAHMPGPGGGTWLGWIGYVTVKVAIPAIIAKVTGRAMQNVTVAIQESETIPERAKPIADVSARWLGYAAETYAYPTSFGEQHPAIEYTQNAFSRAAESPYVPEMSSNLEDAIVVGGGLLLAGETVTNVGVGTVTEFLARSVQAFLTTLPTP